MDATERLVRGQTVNDTGAPIRVPVGPSTLGRIINVIGEAIDERGPVETEHYAPIHAEAPALTDTEGAAEILETGIKVNILLRFPFNLNSINNTIVKTCSGRRLDRPLFQGW